jgi:nucleotide-binding universal stress UspA family protein
MSYQRILAAMDRSALGQTVFEHALVLAKQNNASLMLFHCLPIEPELTPYAPLYHEDLTGFSNLVQDHLKKEITEARSWLEECSQKAIARGVTPEWDCKVGDAGRGIREIANSWNADLVVLGRRGLGGIAEMFLGSVSNYIVHHVRTSILIVQGKTSK